MKYKFFIRIFVLSLILLLFALMSDISKVNELRKSQNVETSETKE